MTTFKELVPASTDVVKNHPQALSYIEVLLGYNTLTNQPLIVGLGPYAPDFSGPTGQHLMIQGMTGIGKTVMAETLVTAAINMYTEDELEVVWLPRSLDCDFPFRDHPRVHTPAEYEDYKFRTARGLNEFFSEILSQKADSAHVLVVADNFEDHPATRLIDEYAPVASQYNIHFVTIMQKGKLYSDQLRDVSVSFQVPTPSQLAWGLKAEGYTNVSGVGNFLVRGINYLQPGRALMANQLQI